MARKQSSNDRSAERAQGLGTDEGEGEGEELPFLRRVWDQVGPIGLAVLIALAIRALIIESYYVPSGSMFPTMWIGDHVFVSKFSYGARIPFTDVTLPALRDPERGEIAVFALGRGPNGRLCPLDQCPDFRSEGFVKRIVGLPGDTIEVRDKRLYVNGERVPSEPTGDTFEDRGLALPILAEALPGCPHEVLDNPHHPGLASAPKSIPEDRYFLMGDNRDNSQDSRVFGTVHRRDLKGPVLFNYWAWNNQRSWAAMLNPLTWLDLLWNEMHWGRFGMTYSCEE